MVYITVEDFVGVRVFRKPNRFSVFAMALCVWAIPALAAQPGGESVDQAGSQRPLTSLRADQPSPKDVVYIESKTESGWKGTVDLVKDVAVAIVFVGSIVGFFIFKGWRCFKTARSVRKMADSVNNFIEKDYPSMRKEFDSMTFIVNAFMTGVVPDILQGFENKELVKSGTFADWTKTIGTAFVQAKSPRELTEEGESLLEQSGLKSIIDEKIDEFIEALENKDPQSPLDVEDEALYLLKLKR